MIVIYVNSMKDTATFDAIYSNLDEDAIILHNPSRAEVDTVLKERPSETLLCFGHGVQKGLFSHDFKSMLIDAESVPLLKERDVIGIWCYASVFGAFHNLRGFFTYMFISNHEECAFNRCGWYEDDVIFAENRIFAEQVNRFIRENTPLEQWIERFNESRTSDLSFVKFNYSNFSYLDGVNPPQQLVEEGQLAQTQISPWEIANLEDEESDIDWDEFFQEEDE